MARRTYGRPKQWPSARRVVSFTFDDFPRSAATTGSQILESFGARGTFFASFGLAGGDSPSGAVSDHDTIRAVASRGHEIGCHTFGHLDCSLTSPDVIARDCDMNRRIARQHDLPVLSSFSYPFGALNRRARKVIANDYTVARTVWTGVNRGRFDSAALRAVPLMMRDGPTVVLDHVRDFLENGGWLIFYSHDVADDASKWGCQPSYLRQLCDRLLREGAEILPLRDVGL